MSDATPQIVGYIVRNRVTGKTKAFISGRRASDSCNRQDFDYGAVCTSRVAVWADQPNKIAEFDKVRGV